MVVPTLRQGPLEAEVVLPRLEEAGNHRHMMPARHTVAADLAADIQWEHRNQAALRSQSERCSLPEHTAQ